MEKDENLLVGVGSKLGHLPSTSSLNSSTMAEDLFATAG
jgi:hypothetical protein